MVEPTAAEHGRRRWRIRPVQHLERVQDGGRPHLEEGVAKALLCHVERYLGVEHPHVERQEAIHVLGQEREVVNPVDELHGDALLDNSVAGGKCRRHAVQEHRALTRVRGEGGGALELGARLLGTTEFLEQIAPHRG